MAVLDNGLFSPSSSSSSLCLSLKCIEGSSRARTFNWDAREDRAV